MNKEKKAIERLKFGEETSKQYYSAPLIICYSGGKDSDVLIDLAMKSGIDFEVLHNHTTADAPETYWHIENKFHELRAKGIKCIREFPTYKGKPTSIWDLIIQKGLPPTRLIRYCCSVLKEKGGKNRAISTGVRWAESTARSKRGIYEDINRNKEKKIILNNDNDSKRRFFERCEKQAKTIINPIIDWNDDDVKDYIQSEHVKLNPLYECGFSRVGCIGCPLAGNKRYREFERYPKYKSNYIRTFDKMINKLRKNGKEHNIQGDRWMNGYDVFRWWMEEDFRQIELFPYEEFEDKNGVKE